MDRHEAQGVMRMGAWARLTRRCALRSTLRASAALSASAALAGCARAVRGSGSVSAPSPAHTVAVLRFAPWGQWPAASSKWRDFIRLPLETFEQAHPGVRVEPVAPVSGGAALPMLLAGDAPDVFSEYDVVPYLQDPSLLTDLNPLLKEDNIPLSLWSAGQMVQFQAGGGLYFLPDYLNCAVMAVNLGDLDERGLSYPSDGWTSDEAAALFQGATWNSGGVHHYGYSGVFQGVPYVSAGPQPSANYALEIFGGSVISTDATTCTLDDPLVVQAMEWWMGLFEKGVAASLRGAGSGAWPATFIEDRNNNLLSNAMTWLKSYKWDFYPIPKYPAGQLSWVGSEGYALNPATAHSEAAWELLKFVAVETTYQVFAMKTILEPPGLVSLWPQMNATMEAVVPGFRGKGLRWFAESAASWGRAVPAYRYDPTGAMTVINSGMTHIVTKSGDVAAGLRQITDQVNALVGAARAQATAVAGAAAQAKKAFPTVGSAVAAVGTGI